MNSLSFAGQFGNQFEKQKIKCDRILWFLEFLKFVRPFVVIGSLPCASGMHTFLSRHFSFECKEFVEFFGWDFAFLFFCWFGFFFCLCNLKKKSADDHFYFKRINNGDQQNFYHKCGVDLMFFVRVSNCFFFLLLR